MYYFLSISYIMPGSMTRRVKRGGAKKPRSSAKRSYRKRVKASRCRGKRASSCRQAPGCKYSMGKKRSFCRKSRNTRRKGRKSSGSKSRKR